MKARRGQVVLYMVAILGAIVALTMMNVELFTIIRDRNHVMNAGDAAALAVAKCQMEMLNEIGQLNIDHLKAALEGNEEECQEIVNRQLRISFLGPIERGIPAGNHAAEANGAERNNEVEDIIREHASEVQELYVNSPDSYPEPWEGAWEEYAAALYTVAGNGISAGPDNVQYVDAGGYHYLLDPQFYCAIGGCTWCWFKYHAPGLLDSYGGYESWGPLPTADDDMMKRRCVNSEVYSLQLLIANGSAVELLGAPRICELTGAAENVVTNCDLLTDKTQRWMLYDTSYWRKWDEIDPYGKDFQFPVMGRVKPQYDVLGAAAACRIGLWVAAAKPFGCVQDEKGELKTVVEDTTFVLPSFAAAKLVPVDSIQTSFPGETADPDWINHVRKHLAKYLADGVLGISANCWYCKQLQTFEKETFRHKGVWWLKLHPHDCERGTCGGCGRGGTRYGH